MAHTFATAVLVVMGVLSSDPAGADPVRTQAEACGILTRTAERVVRPQKKPDEYFCQPHISPSEYYVFSLRSRYPAADDAAPGWIGSNMVGWFAIRKRDGAVVRWDIGNELADAVVSGSSKASK